jgi:alanine-synthesizing transaminase
MHYAQEKQLPNVSMDDIIIGNGVSELIVMAMQALLDNGDEVLVPAPDYPLWTAAVSLAGGKALHYVCDEEQGWFPSIDDIRAKITPNTRAIVVINPNNPTGAVYPPALLQQIVDLARQHQLIIYADEIYDKVLYDEVKHTSIASLAPDLLVVTFNGLSKNYRACGYRAGWMILCGEKKHARDYIEGLNMLASMRLCANVPAQFAIRPPGRLSEHRRPGGPKRTPGAPARPGPQAAHRYSGRDMRQAAGALYLFPGWTPRSTPSATTSSSSWNCCRKKKCCWCRAAGLTGLRRITSAWYSFLTRMT